MSPSVCRTLHSPHLSAGAHWRKGIGPTHEHFPASDNQDSHVVLTLLLKQQRGSNRGTSSPAAELGVFPSRHIFAPQIFESSLLRIHHTLKLRLHLWMSPLPTTSLPGQLPASPPIQILRVHPRLHQEPLAPPGWASHAGGLVPTRCPSIPTTTSLPPALSQAPGCQGHVPRSSLCFGRSGVCPRWRPTLWPVGGAHRHHTAVPLTARAGSSRGWRGQRAGKGPATACRVRFLSQYPRGPGRAARLLTPRHPLSPKPSIPARVGEAWSKNRLSPHRPHAALAWDLPSPSIPRLAKEL